MLQLPLILYFNVLCHQTPELPDWAKQQFILLSESFEHSCQLSPNILQYDLNSDGVSDIAMFVTKKSDGKTGILFLINGQEKQYFLAGAGNPFGPGDNDYEWADKWRVFEEKVTYEMTFLPNGDIDGTQEVILQNPALSIREDEGSGGLIYYNGSKFVWIHQGD